MARPDERSDSPATRRGRAARTKGAAGEREFAALIQDLLGVRLVRNLEQTRSGGADLLPHPEETGPVAAQIARYAIEIKRHAKVPAGLVASWWGQCVAQGRACGGIPTLAYRQDRGDWRLVLPLASLVAGLGDWEGVDWTAELSLPGFCAMVRERA